jgi:hypothetical protein
MDVMHDTLMNGRKFRVLNIVDDFNREAMRIELNFSIGSNMVIKILERLTFEHGKPKATRGGNGPEFVSSAFSEWCLDKELSCSTFSLENLCRIAKTSALTGPIEKMFWMKIYLRTSRRREYSVMNFNRTTIYL